MNSVLDGFRVRRLDAIQEEMVQMVDCNAETAIEKSLGEKDMKS